MISFLERIWTAYALLFPHSAVRIRFRYGLGKWPNINHPIDLNEKINYLKFHEDIEVWARLADKYAVREYVRDRGLESILVPLYGKYDSPDDLFDDWNKFPSQFVIKSNHGCGTIKIVNNKVSEDIKELEKVMDGWLKRKFGIDTIEPHYRLIKPCLIVEKLLEDSSVAIFSQSLVDYKIFCFDGKPYCTLIVADRNFEDKSYQLDCYDINWNRIEGAMSSNHEPVKIISKPTNYEYMIECAKKLSYGHKQVRVDLYNIQGKVYFGEMTFTSQGGYMDYFSPDFLLEMGNQIK